MAQDESKPRVRDEKPEKGNEEPVGTGTGDNQDALADSIQAISSFAKLYLPRDEEGGDVRDREETEDERKERIKAEQDAKAAEYEKRGTPPKYARALAEYDENIMEPQAAERYECNPQILRDRGYF